MKLPHKRNKCNGVRIRAAGSCWRAALRRIDGLEAGTHMPTAVSHNPIELEKIHHNKKA
jgi:hypothetical protein